MMKAEGFIAQKIRFKGRLSAVAIAISFFVIIIAVAISGGFRHEIRKGVASITGDIVLTSPSTGYYGEDTPISATPSYMDRLLEVKGVESISPAVYRAGIVRAGSDIHGVMIKGTPDYADTTTLGVSVPRRLADLLRLKEGDPMLTYFVGERVKVRLTITADRDYDFVQVVDKRAACLEPVRQLSGWHHGSYCTPKDYTTNYYFDCLSKGTHTIESEYYIDRAGLYETGTCTVECAYAPEFRAVAPSLTLDVK